LRKAQILSVSAQQYLAHEYEKNKSGGFLNWQDCLTK